MTTIVIHKEISINPPKKMQKNAQRRSAHHRASIELTDEQEEEKQGKEARIKQNKDDTDGLISPRTLARVSVLNSRT